jgi:murein DD-endopeptidase MepM/ murein hydrolase activator NlpD
MAQRRCLLACILSGLILVLITLLAGPAIWQEVPKAFALLVPNVSLNSCNIHVCPPNEESNQSGALDLPVSMPEPPRGDHSIASVSSIVPAPTSRKATSLELSVRIMHPAPALNPAPSLALQHSFLPMMSMFRENLIDQQRFFFEPDFYAPQIQAFLETQPGPLKSYVTMVGDRQQSFAEILSSHATLYSVNPKVVLALIEQRSGLVTHSAPSDKQQKFMLGFRGDNGRWEGWPAQLRWAIYELHYGQRDFPNATELTFADKSRRPIPAWAEVSDYAIMRVLAATIPRASEDRLHEDAQSFVATYTRLFGDPRIAPEDWPAPAAPFLSLPMDGPRPVTSFFDHDAPFIERNGAIVTYRGDRDPELSYDGHDGWDFALEPFEPIRAAAPGTVVFAGDSDDGCGAAKAVIIDHHNGYRTLYWHLADITVGFGPVNAGDQLGLNGDTGCSNGFHLHFQVQYLGRDTDPAGWCGPSDSDPWAHHPAGQISTWLWRDVPSPCQLPADAVAVSIGDLGFTHHGEGWEEVTGGINGMALRIPDEWRDDDKHVPHATWQPPLSRTGKYRVLAWSPYVLNGNYSSNQVRYEIGHAKGKGDKQEVELSQRKNLNWWADLGVHFFDPQHQPFVRLKAHKDHIGTDVVYDTLLWIPIDVQPPDIEDNTPCNSASCHILR